MDSTHRQTRSQGQAGSQTPAQPLGQPAGQQAQTQTLGQPAGQQAQTQTLGQPAGQQAQPSPVSLTAAEIMRILPHRYPFLLVDKIVEAEPGKRAVGIKNVTINEPFFIGHFPAYPVMPGVLIVEAMAQVAGVAGMLLPENKGKLGLFAGIDGMKFKRQVLPGDTLRLEAEFIAMKMGVGKVRVRASVDGATAAEGEIRVALVSQ